MATIVELTTGLGPSTRVLILKSNKYTIPKYLYLYLSLIQCTCTDILEIRCVLNVLISTLSTCIIVGGSSHATHTTHVNRCKFTESAHDILLVH